MSYPKQKIKTGTWVKIVGLPFFEGWRGRVMDYDPEFEQYRVTVKLSHISCSRADNVHTGWFSEDDLKAEE